MLAPQSGPASPDRQLLLQLLLQLILLLPLRLQLQLRRLLLGITSAPDFQVLLPALLFKIRHLLLHASKYRGSGSGSSP